MSDDLRLSFYRPLGETRGAYAVVFDQAGNALQNVGGTYSLVPYTSADHALFAIPLVNDTERTRYMQAVIGTDILDLPPTTGAELYDVEVWIEQTPDVEDRSTDHLIGQYSFSWAQVIADNWIAHLNVVWDSTNERFGAVGWLERNGELYPNPKSGNLLLHDSGNNVILNLTVNATDSGQGTIGELWFEQDNPTFNPDEVYFVKLRITDQDNVDHHAGASLAAWD